MYCSSSIAAFLWKLKDQIKGLKTKYKTLGRKADGEMSKFPCKTRQTLVLHIQNVNLCKTIIYFFLG